MKKQKIIVFSLSLIGIFIAIMIDYFYRNSNLTRTTYKLIAEPLFYISISLFITSFFIMFIKDQIFHSWIKFTYYWIPISMFLVLIIPGGGGRGSFPSLIDAESISIIMSGLYLIISLIIVIIGSVKNYYFKK